MGGETNLDKLISEMKPELNVGEYVFSSVSSIDAIKKEHILCEFKEKEGITVVLERQYADLYQLSYDYIASWITLNVHSSLDAVGLMALFSTELAKDQISCNVISGYYHDHIFVNQKDAQKAMEVLKKLSQNYN